MQRIAILTSFTALVFGFSPPHEGRGGNEFPGGERKGSVATEIGDKALFVDQMVLNTTHMYNASTTKKNFTVAS